VGEAALVNPDRPEPAVRVRGFCKGYRKQVAVQGVDLAIEPGEIYGLIGPDGAGKSSLMKAVAGVLTYEGGSVEVFGVRVDSEAAAERVKGQIGFMPQGLGLNLYAELSVEENIDFFAQLREVPPGVLAQRKRKLLAMTRLDRFRHRPMKNLSGGMKQKLGLVCTLIHEPDLLILDEPTTGVDPVSRRDFWAILAELLRERGITALVSTAYMDEAARFHRLSLMYGGRVLAEGEPEQIQRVVPGSLVEVEAEPEIEALHRLKRGYPQVEAVGSVLRVFLPGASPEGAQEQVTTALAGLTTRSIRVTEPELEDAFVALLRQRKLAGESEAEVTVTAPADPDPPSHDGIAIEAKGLTRDFGRFRAVDHVGFRVMQGEIFGLLGANGAGKTTVIKMLTGILPPTAGEGHVAGADMRRAGQAIKERIGYMSQAFSLYRDMTVLENIRLYARIYAVPPRRLKQRIRWVIEMAGLQGVEDRLAGKLPMGVRQRLALGCALVHRPRVLFLDEPTSGVDPIGRRRFWEILVQMARREGVAILVTTHYMSEAEHCDHLALMHAGRIIADATPAQMKQTLQQEAGQLLEIATDRPLMALKLLEEAGFEGVALFGKRIHLLAKDPQQARQRIESLLREQGVSLLDVHSRIPSLEDVFVYRIMVREKEVNWQ
jgi:ABC-2 type transport system ATP-binding protein